MSYFAQLRTRNSRLAAQLYRFHLVEINDRECREGRETVRHMLFGC
jgi:hypothetical protein